LDDTLASLQELTILTEATVYDAIQFCQEPAYVRVLCGDQTRWSATAGIKLAGLL